MVKAQKTRKLGQVAAVAYLRVSTDEQTLGMEAQRQAIQGWAKRQGVTILRWFEDMGVSGGADLENRPGMLAALAAVRELKAGALVAAKADRIARDVYVAELVKRELRLAGATLAWTGVPSVPRVVQPVLDGSPLWRCFFFWHTMPLHSWWCGRATEGISRGKVGNLTRLRCWGGLCTWTHSPPHHCFDSQAWVLAQRAASNWRASRLVG